MANKKTEKTGCGNTVENVERRRVAFNQCPLYHRSKDQKKREESKSACIVHTIIRKRTSGIYVRGGGIWFG